MNIILASTSPYRQKQLRDFGLKFKVCKPLFDEESFKGKNKLSARNLSRKLSYLKALSVAQIQPNSIVIGGDQLVHFKNKILGKPHSKKNATQMLKMLSGQTHELITSLCVIYNRNTIIKTVTAKITLKKL